MGFISKQIIHFVFYATLISSCSEPSIIFEREKFKIIVKNGNFPYFRIKITSIQNDSIIYSLTLKNKFKTSEFDLKSWNTNYYLEKKNSAPYNLIFPNMRYELTTHSNNNFDRASIDIFFETNINGRIK